VVLDTVGVLEVTAELRLTLSAFFRGDGRVMSEVSYSRVLTWHFLEMTPNLGKPHLYSCRRTLLISEP
jgi:hypothetical protein